MLFDRTMRTFCDNVIHRCLHKNSVWLLICLLANTFTLCCCFVHLQSLPVAFGVDTAKWICVSTIDVTQLGVAAYLYAGLHETTYAAILLGLILPQVRSMYDKQFPV